MLRLPSNVLRLWRLMAGVAALAAGAVVGGAELAARRVIDDVAVPPALVPVLAAAVVAAVGWWWSGLRFRAWGYELTDQWFRARWGVLGRYSSTVPRNRVQTLTTHDGPLDRVLGLTSVIVHTAGAGAPNVSVPHLDDATVEWLRRELTAGG